MNVSLQAAFVAALLILVPMMAKAEAVPAVAGPPIGNIRGIGCLVSVGNCTSGNCTINLAGTCKDWCTVNLAGACHGRCPVNVASTCGGHCGINVVSVCDDWCVVNAVGQCTISFGPRAVETETEDGVRLPALDSVPSSCVGDLGVLCLIGGGYGCNVSIGGSSFICWK